MTGERVIVVGVDGSDGGRRALQWAVREAADRGGTVQAVAAWRWDLPGGGLGVAAIERQGSADSARLAEEMLEHELGTVPSRVPVAIQTMEGRPAEVLAAATRNADLLVLGSHGHSRVWHTVLGSVAEECIRLAACPVVVIPVAHEVARPSATPATREKAARTTAGSGGQDAP